ncbi:MAG: penicillin-binding protein 2 [Verrucomicrobiaceae bacterium]|nr:MAG: penicillin-binding protein 2 [Verrucomicrobiaceae bacterium]
MNFSKRSAKGLRFRRSKDSNSSMHVAFFADSILVFLELSIQNGMLLFIRPLRILEFSGRTNTCQPDSRCDLQDTNSIFFTQIGEICRKDANSDKMKLIKTRSFRSLLFASLLCLGAAQSGGSTPDQNVGATGSTPQQSIDPVLQKIVEDTLEKSIAELRPQKIIAILADPRTGEILAMASRPKQLCEEGLLNRLKVAPGWSLISRWGRGGKNCDERLIQWPVNDALSFDYEPGSTFKIVACAGYLKEGRADEKIFCELGSFAFAGKTLRDHKPYGDLTPLEVLVKSSNIGAAKMALKLGNEKFRKTAVDFGFGRETGLGRSGKPAPLLSTIGWGNFSLLERCFESGGILPSKKDLDDLTLSRMAFGQSVCVTPIQVLMAYAAIANGGILLPPTLVRAPKTPLPTGVRILPEAIAGAISKALMVDDMWALGRVEGLSVAGKTGSAQAMNPAGGYFKDQYVTSFVGFFPAENPKVVGLVVVDKAKVDDKLNYGGLTAAPVFSQIAEMSAAHLHIGP